ncbi:hypothetical protein JW960_10325 [candidate division KSB1 bacterium]|nr:hypothetical protein [candidate division KSB1 bacterium]
MRNYIPHSQIRLPKSSKPKTNLTRIQQLMVLKKAYESPQERFKRTFRNSGLQGITLHNNNTSTSATPSALQRLATYDAEYRLVRIRMVPCTCN